MSTAAEIAEALPKLNDDELRQVERALIGIYRQRKTGIIFDDAYGVWTEEDQAAVAAQVFALMDGAEEKGKENWAAMNLPLRGEIWLCDLGLAAKVRPVLVLSVPFDDQDYALFHIVPHTTAARGSRFEVAIPLPFLKDGVFNIQGSQSVPRNWLLHHMGTLNESQLALVASSVRHWLKL